MLIEVRLLGGFSVRVDGRQIPAGAWGQRRAAELVKVLALMPGHRATREQLIEILWPGLEPAAGAANLHKAAHYARGALGRPDGVVLRGGSAELAPEGEVMVDAAEFERAADAALAAGSPASCRGAASPYAGELLPDDRYADWALLDTRDPAQFEAAHLRGSLNIGLGGSYATWCGTILDRERPIVLIAEPGRELEAATRLGRIGFDTVAGYLAAGMEPLADSPELIERTARITARSLAERLQGRHPPLLIDVRAPTEYKQRRIDGAINLPLNRLHDRLGSLAAERETVVYCATGYRSAIAASLMRRVELPAVVDMVGGLGAWDAARLPVT